MPKNNSEEKPLRLYFKSYIKVIRNSVGSNMFRNFYVKTPRQGEFDALGDGDDSCAFFVSSVLVIFAKLHAVHATVDATVKDLRESGWQEVKQPQAGDVLVWEARQSAEGPHGHIGFSVGNGRAVSNSSKKSAPAVHDQNFGADNRKIIQIFRMTHWNDTPAS